MLGVEGETLKHDTDKHTVSVTQIKDRWHHYNINNKYNNENNNKKIYIKRLIAIEPQKRRAGWGHLPPWREEATTIS